MCGSPHLPLPIKTCNPNTAKSEEVVLNNQSIKQWCNLERLSHCKWSVYSFEDFIYLCSSRLATAFLLNSTQKKNNTTNIIKGNIRDDSAIQPLNILWVAQCFYLYFITLTAIWPALIGRTILYIELLTSSSVANKWLLLSKSTALRIQLMKRDWCTTTKTDHSC